MGKPSLTSVRVWITKSERNKATLQYNYYSKRQEIAKICKLLGCWKKLKIASKKHFGAFFIVWLKKKQSKVWKYFLWIFFFLLSYIIITVTQHKYIPAGYLCFSEYFIIFLDLKVDNLISCNGFRESLHTIFFRFFYWSMRYSAIDSFSSYIFFRLILK